MVVVINALEFRLATAPTHFLRQQNPGRFNILAPVYPDCPRILSVKPGVAVVVIVLRAACVTKIDGISLLNGLQNPT